MAEEQLDENERIRPREQASNQKHDNWHLKAVKPATQLIYFFLLFLYRKIQKKGQRRTVLLEGEHVVAVPSETASVDRSSHPCLAYSFA